jgi:benzil reductase ((S)-benzoin forming)
LDKLAYITGSSRGIGKALSLLLLKNGYRVVGISRSNAIKHPNFEHIALNLSDILAVNDFAFNDSADQVVLVNNAGKIGEITPVGQIANQDIASVMNVNTIAPQILMNKFIKRFQSGKGDYHILNISSGAGKRPIPSWAAYCASKAAIDLFSETVAEELEWKQMDNWTIHSCAPGVVDTKMQEQIRSSKEENFKMVDNFIAYKENNELYSTEYVATKLFEVIQNPSFFPETIISVRDF